MQQRVNYLEQYTSGETRDLVHSCFHMPPEKGYKEAKKQLQWHFGNKVKITSAFMDKALRWPTIKSEDASSLRLYALFLKSCHNTMRELDYVTDLETPSNLKIIVSKLPFRLRDKWRAVVCNIYDKHKRRATFRDLLAFIDKQSRKMLDPIFGKIQSPLKQTSESKGQYKAYYKANSRGSSFATTVSPVSKAEPFKNDKQGGSTMNGSDAFVKPCMFCNKNHPMEVCEVFQNKPNKEKVEFWKVKGLCFRCLQRGHMSKNCKKRMSCNVCKRGHPTMLHIHIKETQQHQNHTEEFSGSNAAFL